MSNYTIVPKGFICSACHQESSDEDTIEHNKGCEYVKQQLNSEMVYAISRILDINEGQKVNYRATARQVVGYVLDKHNQYLQSQKE